MTGRLYEHPGDDALEDPESVVARVTAAVLARNPGLAAELEAVRAEQAREAERRARL